MGDLSFSSGSPGGTTPGGSTAAGPATGPLPAGTSSRPASGKELCSGAEKVAQVGKQVILASDLNVMFNLWVEKQKKGKRPFPPEQIQKEHTNIEVLLLKQMVEVAMVYEDILRQVPEEALKNVRDKVTEHFEKEEIPRRIKAEGLASRGELAEKLEKMGSSLEREKRTFMQEMLVQQWMQQQVVEKDDETFTPEEIFDYYRQHSAEFEHPARVKWEELMVRKSRHPDRNAAIGLLGHMGNQVVDRGQAGRGRPGRIGRLHGPRRRAARLDQQGQPLLGNPRKRHSLPARRPAQPDHRDRPGVPHRPRGGAPGRVGHAVRRGAGSKIRNKIVRQRMEKQRTDYLAKLHARTPVWTKFDALMAQQQKPSSPFER